MKIKFSKKFFIYSVLTIGAILRLVLFSVSPSNNTYDDHLEVINLYANTHEQPFPSQCWECYQPPIYYILGAVVFKVADCTHTDISNKWKAVQFINPLFSILVLILFLKIIFNFNISDTKKILYASFIAVLPVDLFTSSMIGNDYLLVFSTVASLYYFLKCIDNKNTLSKISFYNFSILSTFVIIGSLSKQHGLLLLIFPSFIVYAFTIRNNRSKYTLLLPILFATLLISISNEFWKYQKTGKFLVSNQDYYDYAKNQFPGSTNKVEFTSFRLNSLFEDPFISNKTAASFPTEIFARTFFDYEWRFLSPKIPLANIVGRLAYIVGVTWLVYFILTITICIWRSKNIVSNLCIEKFSFFIPILVGLLFMLVPLIQTLRFPYFSSMKSTFALPGLIILLAMHSYFSKEMKLANNLSLLLTFINLTYGIILICTICFYLPSTIDHLNGPLWVIPK